MRCKEGRLDEGPFSLVEIDFLELEFDVLEVRDYLSADGRRFVCCRCDGMIISDAFVTDEAQIEQAKEWLLAITLARSEE